MVENMFVSSTIYLFDLMLFVFYKILAFDA